MTHALVHLARLARWGRTLGAHGALRGIENDTRAPVLLRRLAWAARLGTGAPEKPRYAEGLQKLGPAAIKLGQALATRPDVIGEAAAHDLMALQDSLPPVDFTAIARALSDAFEADPATLFQSIEAVPVGAASIAQVHRGVTTDGRTVAIKVLRPGIEKDFTRALETYEWAAAQIERMGGEFRRLRPRAVIAQFRRWTERELNLRMEAASASELADALTAEPDFIVPAVDWARTTRRVMTIEWIDGIKLTDLEALDAAGLDRKTLARELVHGFLQQAIGQGFFHADLHQGNLFALRDGKLAAIDFGIMGRINRRARVYLAEILYGLLTGNYRRVAEIHFEAGYVPPHHNLDEFATALRAVGEPIRGLPVREISVANMLDGLFAITRQFDMQTQPHLLLLQKTMVMVEGVALALDPDVNMWEIAEPFVRSWMRDELGPEARVADAINHALRLVADGPGVLRRLMDKVPLEGAAPPEVPLAPLDPPTPGRGWGRAAIALVIGAALGFGLSTL